MVCERIFLLHLDTAFLLTSGPKKFYGHTRRRLYGSHLVAHNGPHARVSLACRVYRQRPATGVTQGKLFLRVKQLRTAVLPDGRKSMTGRTSPPLGAEKFGAVVEQIRE